MAENELDREDALLELMGLLDRATNLFGPLAPDARARLFAVIDSPNQTTWSNTRGILVNNASFTTLWQACNKHTDYQVRSKPTHEPWPEIPTRAQILAALRGELGNGDHADGG